MADSASLGALRAAIPTLLGITEDQLTPTEKYVINYMTDEDRGYSAKTVASVINALSPNGLNANNWKKEAMQNAWQLLGTKCEPDLIALAKGEKQLMDKNFYARQNADGTTSMLLIDQSINFSLAQTMFDKGKIPSKYPAFFFNSLTLNIGTGASFAAADYTVAPNNTFLNGTLKLTAQQTVLLEEISIREFYNGTGWNEFGLSHTYRLAAGKWVTQDTLMEMVANFPAAVAAGNFIEVQLNGGVLINAGKVV